MKHSILFLFGIGLVAAATTACSHDDNGSTTKTDKAINFTAVVPAPQSRAAAPGSVVSTATLDEFKVWAFVPSEKDPYMNGVDVNKVGEGANTKWEYSPTQYWPLGKTLNFYCISPADKITGTMGDMSGTNPDIHGYTNDYLTDFLYGVNMGLDDKTTQVKINFRHAMSQIRVQLKAALTTIKVRVKNVEIATYSNSGDFLLPRGTTESGDITKNTGTWSALGATKNSVALQDEMTPWIAGTATTVNNTSRKFFVPQTLKVDDADVSNNARIILTAQICDAASGHVVWPRSTNAGYDAADGGFATIIVPLPAGVWQIGHAYNYTITVKVPEDQGAIVFDGDITVDDYPTFETFDVASN